MLDEKTQFALSQYLDGALEETERAAVERLLGENAEARETLSEYRRLNTLLGAGADPLPEMDWDAFSKRISRHIDQQGIAPLAAAHAAEQVRTAPWLAMPRTWLMAASLLLACGIAWMLAIRSHESSGGLQPPVAVAEVRVLNSDQTVSGVAMAEVSIGPAPAAQTAAVWELHPDLLPDQPSSISIAAGPRIAVRDELFSMY